VAANTVTLTFKIAQDGTLKAIGQDAEKTAKSTDKATKSQDRYNKGAKGVAGATANGTKAFSKMRSEMGGSSGVVAAYATFAANVFALTAAFGALQRAAQLQNLEAGFERLANSVGRTSTMMAQSIQTLTDGAISYDQALRTAATGFSAGFSTSEIEGLTQVARGAATALGRDMPDALDRLVRGTAKLEPEILDELGIFVKIDDAVRKYADSLGKTASSLTATERRQAFLNETLQQGKLKFGQVADTIEVNTYDKLAANFDKIAKSALNLFSNVLSPVIGFLANNTAALLGTLVLFGSTLASSMFPALEKMAEKQLHVANTTKKLADAEAQSGKKRAQAAKIAFVKGPSAALTAEGNDFKAVTALKKGLKSGKADAKLFEKALAQINSTMKRTATIAKKNDKLEDKEHKERMKQLEAQEQKILDVQKAEKGRTGTSVKAVSLGLEAEGQEGVSTALDDIRGSSAGQGFKRAKEEFTSFREKTKKGYKELNKDQKGFNKFGSKLMRGFKLGSAGARLFGAALTNAIPFIGQIIFAFGLLTQGLKKLFTALTKPTEAEKQLAEITEKLTEKLEQLKETNDGLFSGYSALAIEQAIITAGTKGLTDEQIDAAVATATLMTKTQTYANNLAVASGAVGEYASAIGNMREEIVEAGSEGGIGALVGNVGRGFLDGAKDLVKGVKDDVVSAAVATKDFAVSTVNSVSDSVTTAVGNAGDAIEELTGKELIPTTNTLDMAGVERNITNFKNATINDFEDIRSTLEDAGLGKIIDVAFEGTTLEKFIDLQMKNVDMTNGSVVAQKSLAKIMSRIQAKLVQSSNNLKTNSDSINKFKENTQDATSSLRTFALKAKESNQYTKLQSSLTDITNAVMALRTTAEDSGGVLTFKELLEAEIEKKSIDLKEFGVTLDEVVASADSGKPFDKLSQALNSAALEAQNGKIQLKGLKDSLKAYQDQFNTGLKTAEFTRSLQTLKQFGKFEVTGNQQQKNAQADFIARKNFLKEEEKQKNAIAEKEVEMAKLNIAILEIQNTGNQKVLDLLTEQKEALDGQVSAAKALNKIQRGKGDQENTLNFFKNQDSRRSQAISAAGEGKTTLERSQNFAQAGGMKALELTDQDGNPLVNEKTGEVLTNLAGKAQAVTAQMQPMLESLKQLGPEGELVAAISAGSLAIAEVFGSLADKITAGTATTADKLAAVGAIIGGIASMLAANSKAKIAGIDKEIAAEKKRDGQSAASVAKIKAMEAKKEQRAKKAFEVNKKLQMAQIVVNTASAYMGIMAAEAEFGVLAPIIAGIALTLGAAQLALVAGTSFQGGGSIDKSGGGPSKIAVGSRSASVDLARGQNAGGELAYARGEQGIGTGMTNFKPRGAFAGYKHRAGGGYIVGEQGPELFMPEMPGEIIPSGQGVGGQTNINFSISAVDSTGVEDLLMNQRGNIIGMIREAANEHGEFFLEGVQETSY